MISGSAVVMGLFSTSGLFIGTKFGKYIKKRNEEIEDFHEFLYSVAEEYYTRNPTAPEDYFNEILSPKWYMKCCFWIQNIGDLVVDPDKVQELISYSEKLQKEEEEINIAFTPEGESEFGVCCPWCGNEDTDKYSWMELEQEEEDEEKKKGAIHCKECGMFTPIATYEECIKLLEKEAE